MKITKNKTKNPKNNCGGKNSGGCYITLMPIYIRKEELKKAA